MKGKKGIPPWIRITIGNVILLAALLAGLRQLGTLSVHADTRLAWSLAFSLLLVAGYSLLIRRGERARDAAALVQDPAEKLRLGREQLDAMQLLQSVAEGSSDVIYAKDRQGRYQLCNKQACENLGLSAEQILGQDDRAIFPADQAARIMANDVSVMTDRVTHTYEEPLSTANKGLVTFLATKGPLLDKDGNVVGVFGISHDITARKAEEVALEESRAELETVIESLEEGLLIASPRGEVLRMNRSAVAMLGFTAASDANELLYKLMPRDVFSIETLDGRPISVEDGPIARISRGESLINLEVLVRRVGTDWSRIFSYGGTQIRGKDGQVRLLVLTMSDVTARKRAEESLLRNQRMESLGTLAAGIAHDFNNILLAIAGNTTLALQDLPAGHPAREGLEQISRASARASDLVQRILLFARAQEAQRQVVNLQSVVEEALKLLRPTLPAIIRVVPRFAPVLPSVSVDTSQMHQVVTNLVINAAHAIGEAKKGREGGVIRVELDSCVLDVNTQVGDQRLPAGHYLRLCVSDDGCGMDSVTLARVFDPFFTTKPVGQGTGLGLPMVHGIVREHDGATEIQSAPGTGTTVIIYLPAAGAVTVPQVLPQDSGAEGRRKRVLYLDDEEALVSLVARFLRKQGCEVTAVTNPVEAVRIFAAQPDAYDVVVTDLSMPVMSGFDVIRAMQDVKPDVAIVMMSGYVRPEDRETASALGVRELLLKPSTVEELGRAIERQVG